MITCIYEYISKNKCIKCIILMHEIACYQSLLKDLDLYSLSLMPVYYDNQVINFIASNLTFCRRISLIKFDYY